MNLDGCFSRKTDDWRTPSELKSAFLSKGFIDTFPYKSDYNEFNNLYLSKKLFVNPPYSKLNLVVTWLCDQAASCKIALLIPARTDTRYFHELLKLDPTIIFIKGRLNFNDSKNSAPFPSLLLLFGYPVFRSYSAMTLENLIKFVLEAL